MRALKLLVDVPEDRELTVRLPEDLPAGPAEVIVLVAAGEQHQGSGRPVAAANRPLLDAIRSLRSLDHTTEEEQVLADFEGFRQAHPFRLSSLGEP